MSLDELLSAIRQRQLLLTGQATLWAPNTPVTQAVTQAIRQHRRALLVLMIEADYRVCAAPRLHRSYWEGDTCCKCRDLLLWVS